MPMQHALHASAIGFAFATADDYCQNETSETQRYYGDLFYRGLAPLISSRALPFVSIPTSHKATADIK